MAWGALGRHRWMLRLVVVHDELLWNLLLPTQRIDFGRAPEGVLVVAKTLLLVTEVVGSQAVLCSTSA